MTVPPDILTIQRKQTLFEEFERTMTVPPDILTIQRKQTLRSVREQ